tara:strand:- start:10227 stop:10376 length:150 start_codon:yes stop_codon:yes gene_type:complete
MKGVRKTNEVEQQEQGTKSYQFEGREKVHNSVAHVLSGAQYRKALEECR